MAVRPLKLHWLETLLLEEISGLIRIAPAGEDVVNSGHELTFDHSVAQDSERSSAARWTTTHP